MSKKFVFGDTKVAKTSEDIREHESKSIETSKATSTVVAEPTEKTVAETEKCEETETVATPAPVAPERKRKKTLTDNLLAVKGKKTENGIVVNVPMEDYMQLTMLKFQTGRTLKDLALQAIHEFVERNK